VMYTNSVGYTPFKEYQMQGLDKAPRRPRNAGPPRGYRIL